MSRALDLTAGAAISVAALRIYEEWQGRRMLRQARQTPHSPPEPTILETPEGRIMLVDAHGLNWPVGEPIAALFHSTGDPWVDLAGCERLNRLRKEQESLPMFVIRAPVFPPPEEQAAARDATR